MTCQRLFARGEHISVIVYTSTKGILHCSILRGGVDGDPTSVVIMDNAPNHHIEEVCRTIQDAGALLIPCLHTLQIIIPFENAFSKVKTIMKGHQITRNSV